MSQAPIPQPTELSLSERRQIERRAAIIDAAMTVFARDGFSAAKMDDVAMDAGVAKGTLYLYYASKEDLFEGAVRAKLVPVIEKARNITEQFDGPADELLRTQLAFIYTNVVRSELAQIMRMIIAEGPRFPRLTAFYQREVIERGEAVVKATLDYGVKRGEFADLRGKKIGKVIMGPAMVAALWRMVFDAHSPLDVDAFFETHIDFILRGLRP